MRGMISFLLACSTLCTGMADVIECDNGDRYNGKVLSMDEKSVTLQNEIAGKLLVPRTRIVSISFRSAEKAPKSAPAVGSSPVIPGKQLKLDSAAVERVQNEFLATAGPEANQLFQNLVSGLQGGQLNLGDIRVKAESTLKELREAQEGLGDDELASLLGSYGAILESFLRQPVTNAPALKRPPAVGQRELKDE